MFNLAIIKLNNKNYRLFGHLDMVARFFGIMNDNLIYFSAFDNDYYIHKCNIEFKNQIHYEQNLLEYNCTILSCCIIKKHNKYTQLWLINNCKKLTNK